jgi:hypothetical protein
MTGRQSSEGVEPATAVLPINSLLRLNDDHELAKVLLFEPVRCCTAVHSPSGQWTRTGGRGRLLIWDDSRRWWMAHEPDLEIVVAYFAQ